MAIVTERDFLNAIIELNIREDITEYATKERDKIDNRNEKRREKPTKTQIENAGLKGEILGFLRGKKSAVASEIAVGLSTEERPVTTAKVSALCGQLVADGKLNAFEVKVPKKGKVKGYSVVESDEIEVENGEVEEVE